MEQERKQSNGALEWLSPAERQVAEKYYSEHGVGQDANARKAHLVSMGMRGMDDHRLQAPSSHSDALETLHSLEYIQWGGGMASDENPFPSE